MGTMINRRRVCGGSDWKSKCPYITDGLVFWLDGIWNESTGIHNDNPTTWEELTGTEVSIPLQNGFYYDNNNNGYKIKGGTAPTVRYNIINDICYSLQDYTIESVFQGFNVSEKGFVFGGLKFDASYNNIYFFLWTDIWYTQKLHDNPKGTIFVQNDGTVSCGKNGIYNMCQKYDSGHTEKTDTFILQNFYGVNNNSTSLFNAIRIYNRALTQEELLHNYNIDKQRFNL